MDSPNHIPIVSMAHLSSFADASNQQLLKQIATDVTTALSETGFVYLADLPADVLQVPKDVFEISKTFFELPTDTKKRFKAQVVKDSAFSGYIPMKTERFFEDRPADLKEAFDFNSHHLHQVDGLDGVITHFLKTLTRANQVLTDYSSFLLKLVGMGLNLKDPDYFAKVSETGKDHLIRTLFYPQIEKLSGLEAGQMRCQEHTDYGLITLLFQDDVGGLEVMNSYGEYVAAVPIPGTVLVNIADFLAMCTGGVLKSTMHRVRITEENFQRGRQSIAFFCEPDGEKQVKMVCGDVTTSSITYNEWRNKRFADTGLMTNTG